MSTSASGGPPVPVGDGQGSPWARSWTGETVHVSSPVDELQAGPPARSSRTLLWFSVAAGGALVAGVVVILALANAGFFGGAERSGVGPFAPLPGRPKPPLAQLCPPPTGSAPAVEPAPPQDGPRVTDADAGISYKQLGAPWVPWDRGPWRDGTLGVVFQRGYYQVTEEYPEGQYLASVLSGKVPATVGDSLTLDLQCAGKQVAEDVRNSYYPRPNTKEQERSEQVTVGGRPAWVSTFHLAFEAEGLTARGETVAVVLVDVGRTDAAVLYLSIPDTHKQFNVEIDRIIDSIRPT
jgi:hypothetical protein